VSPCRVCALLSQAYDSFNTRSPRVSPMLTWIASCTSGSAARKVSVPLLDCYSRAVCRAWLGVIRPCTGRFCCIAILHCNAPLPWCDDGNGYCTVPPLHGDYLGRPLGEYRSVHAYATTRSMAPLSTEANTLSLAVMHYAFQHIRNYVRYSESGSGTTHSKVGSTGREGAGAGYSSGREVWRADSRHDKHQHPKLVSATSYGDVGRRPIKFIAVLRWSNSTHHQRRLTSCRSRDSSRSTSSFSDSMKLWEG
jgi:hypothetical protein